MTTTPRPWLRRGLITLVWLGLSIGVLAAVRNRALARARITFDETYPSD